MQRFNGKEELRGKLIVERSEITNQIVGVSLDEAGLAIAEEDFKLACN